MAQLGRNGQKHIASNPNPNPTPTPRENDRDEGDEGGTKNCCSVDCQTRFSVDTGPCHIHYCAETQNIEQPLSSMLTGPCVLDQISTYMFLTAGEPAHVITVVRPLAGRAVVQAALHSKNIHHYCINSDTGTTSAGNT